jgi:hypothetical protein
MSKYRAASLIAAAGSLAWCTLCSAAVPIQGHWASLAERPLVMRLSKDEFRIAFGLTAKNCVDSGCSGVISYRVEWKGDDGMTRSELRRVSYAVLPHYTRALTVDRQYFDTAEGAHTTEIVKVTVGNITCTTGQAATQPLAARNR